MISKEQLLDFLYDYDREENGGLIVTRYEDEPFVIVSCWGELEDFHVVLNEHFHSEEPLSLDDIVDCNWGFDDEWSTCDGCCQAVRTEPNSYGWRPNYWRGDEGLLCGDCVRENFAEEYMESRVAEILNGKMVGCYLVDPEDYEFVEVLHGLEHGLHEGQNDDPRLLAHWAIDNGLDIIFVVHPSQFTAVFDAYLRHSDGTRLMDAEVADIKIALVASETKYSTILREEFRQWPDPATLMKQSLKAAAKAGARFTVHHGDGTYTGYDTFEEYQEGVR